LSLLRTKTTRIFFVGTSQKLGFGNFKN